MIKRREFVAGLGSGAAWPVPAIFFLDAQGLSEQRRIETPPPLRFLGRRVYLAAIVLLIAMSSDPDRRAQ
jgi:hypothetical protein